MEEKSGESFMDKARPALHFAKKHATLLVFLLVILLQFMPNGDGKYPWGGIYMRFIGSDLPVADTIAQQSVENFIRGQVTSAVNQQYPNLPDVNRQKVVEEQLRKTLNEQASDVEQQKQRLREEVVNHYSYEENGKSWLYMPDIDPYYYLRYARNIEEKGHPYDLLKDGIPWDDHMSAPVGTQPENSIHPYVLVGLHKFFNIFDRSIPLMQASNYFSIVFILLSFIPAFFITRRVAGNVGGFFAVTILAIVPAILSRTIWGHADTDAYNVFFPLFIIWFLFIALGDVSRRKQLFFSALSGFAVGLYSFAWSGWWYIFDFALAAFGVYVVWGVISHWRLLRQGLSHFWQHSNISKYVLVGFVFVIVSGIFVSAFTSFATFKNAPISPLRFTTIKQAAHDNLWPNVFTTVAELNPSSLQNAIGSVGGKLLFAIAVLGIILLLTRKDSKGKFDITYSILLAFWFVGTIYASIKGLRFTLLLGPAFAVAFGASVGLIYQYLTVLGEKHFHVKKIITGSLIIFVFGFLIVSPAGANLARQSYQNARSDIPIMNDAWWNVLTKINEDSRPDAIINSWWDFGHHFKYVADRAVTFDGASQNAPQAHWIGRVLQTDNEDEAIAILRMLDCGANTAYDVVFNATNDPIVSINLVKKIIMQDRKDAAATLKDAGISEDVLQYTHCDPPQDYFIVSADMIGKAGVWSHFGLWNFERAEMWKKIRFLPKEEAINTMMERYGYTKEKASEEYKQVKALASEDAANQWISPWSGYIGEPTGCTKEGKDMMVCGATSMNLTSGHAEVRLNQGVAVVGKIVSFDSSGNSKETVFKDGSQNLVLLIWPGESGPIALPGMAELANSMFTRMFYMNGMGLRYFRPFAQDRQALHGNIFAYKVDWAGAEPYVPDSVKPKTSVEQGAQVMLNYIGWADDEVFDSSIVDWKNKNVTQDSSFDDFETKPLGFIAGQGKVIPGFENGVMGMKKGETKTLTIPPEEAYGTDPEAHILGNKTLHFKVRLEAVR
ncbi:MAG TPA: STT3 domain-containing protein [Candidatus Nanoarchaeia archaeon]|nr:STT3 domain-containing protein [Candidatus Nanoarchaeia archaeon]